MVGAKQQKTDEKEMHEELTGEAKTSISLSIHDGPQVQQC